MNGRSRKIIAADESPLTSPRFIIIWKKFTAPPISQLPARARPAWPRSRPELPSILIPFPYAADDHQTRNAEIFARAGAAFVLKESELSPELLTQKISVMIDRPEQLRRMSESSARLAPRDAAARVAATMEKYTQS